MFQPEQGFRKKRRGSLLAPVILLGLLLGGLFGMLFGLFPAGRFTGLWDWSPDPADEQAKADARANGPDAAMGGMAEETVLDAPGPASPGPSRNKSTTAPGFVLPDLFDESLSRSLNDYSGRPVILNFWASWCVPCRTEMPALQRAYEQFNDAGLVVIGINQTFIDDLETARDFVTGLALTFPNVRDDTGITSERLYQVMGLPTSVFITREGKIAHKQVGQMTATQIDTLSRRLLAGDVLTP